MKRKEEGKGSIHSSQESIYSQGKGKEKVTKTAAEYNPQILCVHILDQIEAEE